MLRITSKMASLTTVLDMAKAQSQLDDAQRKASTGLRVERPSDDPSSAAAAMRHDTDIDRVDQCRENITLAQAELGAADTALGQVTDLLIRARELTVQMASDTINATQRATAAVEISKIRDEVRALANTKHNGNYIFSGYETSTEAFSSAGAYQGDTNVRQIWATPSMKMDAAITGSEAFTVTGGIDVLGALQTLSTALSTDNITNIRASLTNLDTAQSQVLKAQAKSGIYINRMTELDSLLDSRKFELTSSRSDVADADITSTLTEMARAQQALSTAVSVSARVINSLSLVDKL